MAAELDIERVVAGKPIKVKLTAPDKTGEQSVELAIKRSDQPDLTLALNRVKGQSDVFSGELSIPSDPSAAGHAQTDPATPGEILTFQYPGPPETAKSVSVAGLSVGPLSCGKTTTIILQDDAPEAGAGKLEVQNQTSKATVKLKLEKSQGATNRYQCALCVGGTCRETSPTAIDASPGDQLTFTLGDLAPVTRTVAGLSLTGVLVGRPFQVNLFDPARSPGQPAAVDVVARHSDLMRQHLRVELSPDAAHPGLFIGQVATAQSTGALLEAVGPTLRVQAGDSVAATLNDCASAQQVAQGVYAPNVLVGRPLKIRVVDLDPTLANTEEVDVTITISRQNHTSVDMGLKLSRIQDGLQQFGVSLPTAALGDTEDPDGALTLQAEDRLSIAYLRGDKSKLSWGLSAHEEDRVFVHMSGGIAPGVPVEICVRDLDRIDAQAVTVDVIDTRSEEKQTVTLCMVAGDAGSFRGSVKTATKPVQGALKVAAGDLIKVQYLDTNDAVHGDRVTVMRPKPALPTFNWLPRKWRWLLSLAQPSRRKLLAELRCLEARLHYYRSTERCAAERHRADLIEGFLRQANDAITLGTNFTAGWDALNSAKRQEIYLIDAAEAEGRESQLRADAKGLDVAEQAVINELLSKADGTREKAPASDTWRGFVVTAMRIRDRHQDDYHYRQSMIRIRMVWVSFVLLALLSAFFYTLGGSSVADALVTNRGLKDVIMQHALFRQGGAGVVADEKPSVHFLGKPLVGEPLALAVTDGRAADKGKVTVGLSCTEESTSLCLRGVPGDVTLEEIPMSKGVFRSRVLHTGTAARKTDTPGYLQLKPGAELLVEYKPAPSADEKEHVTVRDWVRMLSSMPPFEVEPPEPPPSPRALVIAGCVLGAIGACLSTLMSLNSGTQVRRQFDSILITLLGRPLIGFTAALFLFIALNAKMIGFEPTLTIYWLLSLASGFSDRLVMGVVEKIGGKEK